MIGVPLLSILVFLIKKCANLNTIQFLGPALDGEVWDTHWTDYRDGWNAQYPHDYFKKFIDSIKYNKDIKYNLS